MSLNTPRQRGAIPLQSTPPPPSGSPLSLKSISPPPTSRRSLLGIKPPNFNLSQRSISTQSIQSSTFTSHPPSIAPSSSSAFTHFTNTTQPPSTTRFRRGHARSSKPQHAGNVITPTGGNPDLVDLMALEEPDSVFRTFGVRDVRRLEQRANEAAQAKVNELRTMVGERYRDLLSAADSIVRMRGAADTLVEKLEKVGQEIATVDHRIVQVELNRRRPSIVHSTSTSSLSTQSIRTLDSPPTLSLTLHLFLNLSSIVHSLIEQESFLAAARFENVSRVVWRELQSYDDDADNDEGDSQLREAGGGGEGGERRKKKKKKIQEMFPIVVRHHESMGHLGPLIVRRATMNLKNWQTSNISTAQTLATLILLDHASLSSSLHLFLKSRTQALSALLLSHHHDQEEEGSDSPHSIEVKMGKVLNCVVKTVEAVDSIFGASSMTTKTTQGDHEEKEKEEKGEISSSLLLKLLQELGNPSGRQSTMTTREDKGTVVRSSSEYFNGVKGNEKEEAHEEEESTRLDPILTTLPNYPTLARHLPDSILSYNPYLSHYSSSSLPSSSISNDLSTWFESSIESIREGFKRWIEGLDKGERSGRVLAQLRDSTLSVLRGGGSSIEKGDRGEKEEKLQGMLKQLFEEKVEEIYRDRLDGIVRIVKLQLREAKDQSTSPPQNGEKKKKIESDSANFLFSLDTTISLQSIKPLLLHHHQSSTSTSTQLDPLHRHHHQQQSSPSMSNPFQSFLHQVSNRVAGRSPLIERGVSILEGAAREVRVDLRNWMEVEDEEKKVEGGKPSLALRERYSEQVAETLRRIVGVLEETLTEREEGEASRAVEMTLFVGTFAQQLSQSRSFTRDLFLGVAPSPSSTSRSTLEQWQESLRAVQARSLKLWRQDAVSRSIALLRKGTDQSVVDRSRSPSSSSSTVPTTPSTYLLQSISSLIESLNALPIHRLHSDPSPASSLLESYSIEALSTAKEFVEMLKGATRGAEDVKRQLVFDVSFIGLIVDQANREEWDGIAQRFLQLLPSVEGTPTLEEFVQSATNYILRTQTILSPLVPNPSFLSQSLSSQASSPTNALSTKSIASNRLLPLGPPSQPSTTSAEFKSMVKVVKPGPRLGLLPTKV